jgi:hypothetical protein
MGTEPEFCIYQFRDYDSIRMTQVNIDYGIKEAEQRFKDGTSYSAWEAVKRILISLVYFIVRGGWLRGRLGVRELWSGVVLISIIYWCGSDLRYRMTREDCAKSNRICRLNLLHSLNGVDKE